MKVVCPKADVCDHVCRHKKPHEEDIICKCDVGPCGACINAPASFYLVWNPKMVFTGDPYWTKTEAERAAMQLAEKEKDKVFVLKAVSQYTAQFSVEKKDLE